LPAQLRDDLAREQAREAYAQARTTLADSAYAADNLEGPAKDLNLELRQADNITRNGGGEPLTMPDWCASCFRKTY